MKTKRRSANVVDSIPQSETINDGFNLRCWWWWLGGAFYVSGGFPLGAFYGVVAIDVAHDGVEVFLGVHTFVDLIGDTGCGSDRVLLAFGLGGDDHINLLF